MERTMSRSRLLRVEGLLSSNIPKLEDREGRSLVVMVANERRVAWKAIGGLLMLEAPFGLRTARIKDSVLAYIAVMRLN